MDEVTISRAFAALGHAGRLRVFRLVMRFHPRGVRPTELAAALGLRQNTLSHHLHDLAAADLLTVARSGRSLFYSVNMAAARAVLDHFAFDTGRGRADLMASLLTPLSERPAMADAPFNVLFLCSGNSARSIFAEALLRDLGHRKFRAYSAGYRPSTALNPFAVDVLRRNGHDVAGMHAKPVSDYRQAGAAVMEFVFTVCDTAAAEECPPWPGQPVTGHWGLKDPAKAEGTDAEKGLAFAQTYAALRRRIAAFVELPLATLDRLAMQTRIDSLAAPLPDERA